MCDEDRLKPTLGGFGMISQCAARDGVLLDLVQKQPPLIAFNLVLACVLVALLQDVVAEFRLLGWLGVMGVTQVASFAVWWHLRRAATALSSHAIGRRLTFASLLSGIAWGLAGLLLVGSGTTPQITVASFTVGGVTAGAITVLPSHPVAYYAVLLPALLPYMVQLGVAADPTAQIMGLVVLLYLGGISCLGHELNRALRRALGDAGIIADLEAQRRALQQEVERSSVELATIM